MSRHVLNLLAPPQYFQQHFTTRRRFLLRAVCVFCSGWGMVSINRLRRPDRQPWTCIFIRRCELGSLSLRWRHARRVCGAKRKDRKGGADTWLRHHVEANRRVFRVHSQVVMMINMVGWLMGFMLAALFAGTDSLGVRHSTPSVTRAQVTPDLATPSGPGSHQAFYSSLSHRCTGTCTAWCHNSVT